MAARLAPLHGHHVLQVQHSLAEMPEQRVARRQRAHFVTQICELAAGRGIIFQADGDAGLARINAQAELLQAAFAAAGHAVHPHAGQRLQRLGAAPQRLQGKAFIQCQVGPRAAVLPALAPAYLGQKRRGVAARKKALVRRIEAARAQHAANHRQQHHTRERKHQKHAESGPVQKNTGDIK